MSYTWLLGVVAACSALLSLAAGTQRRFVWEVYLPLTLGLLVLLGYVWGG